MTRWNLRECSGEFGVLKTEGAGGAEGAEGAEGAGEAEEEEYNFSDSLAISIYRVCCISVEAIPDMGFNHF
ncbi:MAG: hypothetical protein F6K31_17380 [Symploca sp. SIO2G7]|nr:hypothetical protein [Symploca sp. SIO2G7]